MNPIETEWHQLKTHELRGWLADKSYDMYPSNRFQ